MENQSLSEEKPTNKNRTIIIVAVVIVVLCCCLVIAVAVGFYAFTSISSVQRSSEQPLNEFVPPSNSLSGAPPSGGLANDTLKNDTWQVLAPAAASFGCVDPSGSGLTIEVLQEPDSGGVWVERWPVKCSSGETMNFEVEFVLDDTGAMFNIKLMQD